MDPESLSFGFAERLLIKKLPVSLHYQGHDVNIALVYLT